MKYFRFSNPFSHRKYWAGTATLLSESCPLILAVGGAEDLFSKLKECMDGKSFWFGSSQVDLFYCLSYFGKWCVRSQLEGTLENTELCFGSYDQCFSFCFLHLQLYIQIAWNGIKNEEIRGTRILSGV